MKFSRQGFYFYLSVAVTSVIHITIVEIELSLTSFSIGTNRLKLPGRFYELNIHYGLFVGGLGDFREIFLGLWDNFRGCIQQLLYNGQDLLTQLKNNKKVK